MRDVGPFLYGTSVNPLANVYASMRYALAAYGSLPRAYDRAGGYDSGGYLQPGMNLAYNGTGRPEPVLTTAQWNILASSGGARQAGADQRSFNWTLVGSHLTPGEQMAEMERRMAFLT
jgi:SLT domain-containing protein